MRYQKQTAKHPLNLLLIYVNDSQLTDQDPSNRHKESKLKKSIFAKYLIFKYK